jgi:hypothetical protein
MQVDPSSLTSRKLCPSPVSETIAMPHEPTGDAVGEKQHHDTDSDRPGNGTKEVDAPTVQSVDDPAVHGLSATTGVQSMSPDRSTNIDQQAGPVDTAQTANTVTIEEQNVAGTGYSLRAPIPSHNRQQHLLPSKGVYSSVFDTPQMLSQPERGLVTPLLSPSLTSCEHRYGESPYAINGLCSDITPFAEGIRPTSYVVSTVPGDHTNHDVSTSNDTAYERIGKIIPWRVAHLRGRPVDLRSPHSTPSSVAGTPVKRTGTHPAPVNTTSQEHAVAVYSGSHGNGTSSSYEMTQPAPPITEEIQDRLQTEGVVNEGTQAVNTSVYTDTDSTVLAEHDDAQRGAYTAVDSAFYGSLQHFLSRLLFQPMEPRALTSAHRRRFASFQQGLSQAADPSTSPPQGLSRSISEAEEPPSIRASIGRGGSLGGRYDRRDRSRSPERADGDHSARIRDRNTGDGGGYTPSASEDLWADESHHTGIGQFQMAPYLQSLFLPRDVIVSSLRRLDSEDIHLQTGLGSVASVTDMVRLRTVLQMDFTWEDEYPRYESRLRNFLHTRVAEREALLNGGPMVVPEVKDAADAGLSALMAVATAWMLDKKELPTVLIDPYSSLDDPVYTCLAATLLQVATEQTLAPLATPSWLRVDSSSGWGVAVLIALDDDNGDASSRQVRERCNRWRERHRVDAIVRARVNIPSEARGDTRRDYLAGSIQEIAQALLCLPRICAARRCTRLSRVVLMVSEMHPLLNAAAVAMLKGLGLQTVSRMTRRHGTGEQESLFPPS